MYGDLLLRNRISKRRAMTLVELLVVISIMMLLAAYALPKLEPMSKQRKIREAARAVSVFLSRARSRAIETGRPCGVVFQRVDPSDPNLANACTMLYQAEAPPPYAGDTFNARVRVLTNPPLVIEPVNSSIQNDLLRVGDRIQFNGQGPWCTIDGPDQQDNSTDMDTEDANEDDKPDGDGLIDGEPLVSIDLSVDSSYVLPPWPPNEELSFKILRQPRRTIAQPLSLPVGTCVDLSASGIDRSQDDDGDGIADQTFATGSRDVVIMFSPNGSVSRYYWDTPADGSMEEDAIEPIFLMIGWREQTFDPDPNIKVWVDEDIDEEALPNWQVLSNMWIGLNPQTGLISVAENAYPQEVYDKVSNLTPGYEWDSGQHRGVITALRESRKFARQAQSKGGR